MSVCYVKDNEKNLAFALLAQPTQVVMYEITQGEKTKASARTIICFVWLCNIHYKLN